MNIKKYEGINMTSKITVTIGNFDFNIIRLVDQNGEAQEYNIADLLKFNADNYEIEYTKQASNYIYWASVYTICKEQEESENNLLSKIRSDNYNQVYNDLSKQGIRATKDHIESLIVQDTGYQAQLIKVNESHRLSLQLQYLVKAFEQRRDMLIQFGAEQRKDYRNGN